MCSGLLLAKLMQVLLPNSQFVNLNQKARSKKAALENLEQALGLIWRSKACNTSRIPKSTDIYEGSTSSIAMLLQELYEVYVVKPLYARNAVKILTWFHTILKQYQLGLDYSEIFEEGDLSSVWPSFQSGTAIFCVIFHLFGPITVGEGSGIVLIDPMRVIFNPQNISEFRANLVYVWSLLRAIKVEVIWDIDDWLTSADTEFIIVQLQYIYDSLKNRQCSLPPAQGQSAGVTSGRNGEPLVVGLVFADTKPTTVAALQRSRQIVLLGSGDGALPLLPIDTSGVSGRFVPTHCPVGLISTDVKILRAPLEVKGLCTRSSTQRKEWNKSALSVAKEEQLVGKSAVLNILRFPEQAKQKASAETVSNKLLREQVIAGIANTSGGAQASSSSKAGGGAPDMNAHITLAVQSLEGDMKAADLEMEEREDVLAAQYLDLEGNAGDMSNVVYERALQMLEMERKKLEEDRIQLQEHFAMRLASIKLQHQEAAMRSEALYLEQTRKQFTNNSPTSPSRQAPTTPSNAQSTAPFSPMRRTVSKPTQSDLQALAKAEKGWISSSIKGTSHNTHLTKLQRESAAALKDVWEPPKLKAKAQDAKKQVNGVARQTPSEGQPANSADTSNVPTLAGLSIHDLMMSDASGYTEAKDDTPADSADPEVVFRRFKLKLNSMQLKYMQIRNPAASSSANNTPAKVCIVLSRCGIRDLI
jgi:hypothetical protein